MKKPTKPKKRKTPAKMTREEAGRQCFVDALSRAIEFHIDRKNWRHRTSLAVIVALKEVRDAAKAYLI